MTKKAPYIITGALSAALFYVFYGFRVLDPLYVDWLLSGGDLSQHYLGWALYRNSPFKLNFGLTNALAYPFSTSIVFTDSIPLMAVPCKIIGRFTYVQFQYFGIWALLCIVLMGLLTCFLLNRYIDDPVVLVFSSLLTTISPCMFKRIFWHTSLGAHFLIILGLILIVYRNELCDTLKHTIMWWSLTGFLCSFIHIYFLAMNAVFLLCFICFRIIDLKRKSGSVFSDHDHLKVVSVICAPVSYFVTAALSVWLLGGFSSGMNSGAPGLNYYSFNLNSFFNPQGWSVILPDLPYYADGQYEGFAYLGFGMLTAVIIAIVTGLLAFRRNMYFIKRCIPYILCVFILIFFIIIMSESNEITFGSRLLFSVKIPDGLRNSWEIFRSCGRLVWPAVYIICLITHVILFRSMRPVFAASLLVLCLFLQLFDLRNIIELKHSEFAGQAFYTHRLNDKLINSIADDKDLKHIVFLDKDNLTQEELYSFAEFAARKRLTINDFYFARSLNHPVNEAALDFFMHPSEDTLYVISDESYEMRYMFDLSYYKYGDLSLGLKSPLNVDS
ncbi:MAG: hypothetical protein IKP31_05685 [Lachnospiraceae bacterium]|nr:hypothetical protein [Lachnospiraceae bacterium]